MVKAKDTILYVDDDFINLEVLKAQLEDNYNVITELSTSRAYEILKTNFVKIIIADQRMPEESGLSFLEKITPEFPDAIKIIFTAHVDHEAAISAVNQGGIYRYIMKPWNSKEMKDTLENAIREFDLKSENKALLQALTTKNSELEKAYKQLKESEKKFYSIFANSNDGIVIYKDKEIQDANQAFLNIIGFPKDNINKKDINAYLKENFPGSFDSSKNLAITSDSYTEIELEYSNAQKKSLELNNRALEYDGSSAILSIVRDITERKQVEQRILEAIINTQEEYQAKYARELHDGLGPILSTLKMYTEWLTKNTNAPNKDIISNQSIVCVNEAINIVKEIANNLSPHVLQRFGLVNAIQTYIDSIKDTNNIDFIISSNLTNRFQGTVETALYRVLLECINNSLKHAKAQKIIIKFKYSKNLLSIIYSDNGVGFNVKDVLHNAKGMGLFNMQNRLKLIGGEIRIKSNLNIGTDIEIHLKVNHE